MDPLHTTYKGRTVARAAFPSENKLEYFNDCPGKEAVEKWINEHGLAAMIGIVDITESFWQNEHDTLVVEIRNVKDKEGVALLLGKLAVSMGADEFHFKMIAGHRIVRFWWD